MFKEIVGITKNYLDERIAQLEGDLKILEKFLDAEATGYKAMQMVIQELENVRKTMLNACDYGKWLEQHNKQAFEEWLEQHKEEK